MPLIIDLTYLTSESEDEEDTPMTPTPRITYCDWGVCDDILEMIGKQIVEVKKTREIQMGKSHFKSCRMNREFQAIVKVLFERNKSITLKNMKYNYVRKDQNVRWSGLSSYDWSWRNSLEERRKKIHRKELMDQGH